MIIFNTPLKISHLHRTIYDWIKIYFLKEKEVENDAKFIFTYFSYEPDFEYLKLSIKSLISSFESRYIRSINIFVDQKKPFEDWQKKQLELIFEELIFYKVENFSWSSAESTNAELKCFNKVCELANEKDMLVKVDSDILFFSSFKMVKILKSGIHAAGDGHSENYKFAQGGLYMIRTMLVRNYLSRISEERLREINSMNNSPAEDRAISRALDLNSTPFFFTRLMIFPSEYRKIKKITNFNKFDFCAAHFVKDKEQMFKFYKLIG